MIQFIEELSFNAWPAPQLLHYDGWMLRFAEGYTRRANSVNPIYGSSLPTADKIANCEQLYRQSGLDTVFKITNDVYPTNLDALLDSAGYKSTAHTTVMTIPLDDYPHTLDGSTLVSHSFAEGWLNDYFRISGQNIRFLLVARRLLQNILPATCFMSIEEDGEVIAIGLGIVERGYLGLYDILTDSAHRNRGVGTRLVSQLLAWGKANGAQHAYLQVMNDNAPARHLYMKLGFREVYQYWYRVKR